MIAVDTSAVIAILQGEPETERFSLTMLGANGRLMSAVSVLEATLVLGGRADPRPRWRDLDELIAAAALTIVPFDHDLAMAAREAFFRFGKGRHPAGLNMGDCASYALARSRGLPLLFKGNDFSRTDIEAAA